MTQCPICNQVPSIKSSHNSVWLIHDNRDCQLRRTEQYVTAQDAEHGWKKTCQYYIQRNLRGERKTFIDKVVWEQCTKDGLE